MIIRKILKRLSVCLWGQVDMITRCRWGRACDNYEARIEEQGMTHLEDPEVDERLARTLVYVDGLIPGPRIKRTFADYATDLNSGWWTNESDPERSRIAEQWVTEVFLARLASLASVTRRDKDDEERSTLFHMLWVYYHPFREYAEGSDQAGYISVHRAVSSAAETASREAVEAAAFHFQQLMFHVITDLVDAQ